MSDRSSTLVSLDSYLTLKEVTTTFKVATSTLYRWTADGKFPKPVRLGENCVRWRVSDIKAWQDSRDTVEPVKKAG